MAAIVTQFINGKQINVREPGARELHPFLARPRNHYIHHIRHLNISMSQADSVVIMLCCGLTRKEAKTYLFRITSLNFSICSDTS